MTFDEVIDTLRGNGRAQVAELSPKWCAEAAEVLVERLESNVVVEVGLIRDLVRAQNAITSALHALEGSP